MHSCRALFTTTISLLLIWQLIVSINHLPSYILPGPWQTLHAAIDHGNLILPAFVVTGGETLLGFILGSSLGFFAALTIAYFKPVRYWLLPLLIVSQALPTFAIAPLLVIWFGYGLAGKILTTAIMLFFPITSSFLDGLRQTPQAWLDMAQSMQAKKWRLFWHIKIPAALPALASGLRLAATIAPMGAIVGEWVGASQGLGFLVLNSNARLQIDLMFACLAVIILLALILYFSVDVILKFVINWQR